MTNKIYREQELLDKLFEADSVTIQKNKSDLYYTIIKDDFTVYIDLWGKSLQATCSIYHLDKEVSKENHCNLIKALIKVKADINQKVIFLKNVKR